MHNRLSMVEFRSLKLLFLGLCTVALVACSSDPDTGDDGTTTQADASTASAPDAGLNQPDAMPSAALGFLDACDVNDDQCDSAADEFCFSFNNKGPHCTHACSGPADCAAPSTGCSGMGVCKVP